MVCNGGVKHAETCLIYVDKREVIIFIMLKLFASHFNCGLGGKIGIHQENAWDMMLTNGAVGSSNAYITRSITSPAHPWMVLWGQTSSLRAVTICLCSARILAKSRRGTNEGGFFKNTAASSYVMRWSILKDCAHKWCWVLQWKLQSSRSKWQQIRSSNCALLYTCRR